MVRVGQGSYNYQHAGGGKKPGEIGARLRQEGLTVPMRPEAVQRLNAALTKRTTWEFCQLLDRKVINSKKGFAGWLEMAKKNEWIKTDV